MPKVFTNVTNKHGLIVFGGEASDDYAMIVTEAPAFDAPVRKSESVSIPGRNGVVLFQQDAYEDTVRSYKVAILASGTDLSRAVASAESWLNSKKGYQRLEDDFEPEIFRLAYYNGGTDFSNRIMMAGEADISFVCRPERFYKDGEEELTVTNGDVIYNLTRFASKPLIHIEGTGTFTIRIGNTAIEADVTDYINIDSDTMNAYRLPAENMNSRIRGTFLKLEPGNNTIEITDEPSLVTIIPRYYTI